ncbi:PQQ-like beta-propeller repeat protein [Maricaulis sp.]|uniref:outer membrane protein assembly factor BamB family protein n=1 Tax=Maricaulis sp. TaxID=1486257 RepID=UPI0026300B5D|nr:PQQ-like beta-propeller repeat protein [Maricaulis sp.]MDF1767437.1 PQQ-binding-like beta-propeller repeat protein [Maricaulis sp.]
MIDVKRIRTLLGVALIAPLAACSSVPNPLDMIPGRGNDDDNNLNGDAPTDGRVSILNFEQGLRLDGESAGVVELPTAYVNTVWPQPGGYPTNAVQHTQASGPLDIAWREGFGAGSDNSRRINARPVIAAGNVYAIDAGGEVVAMNADTGATVWRHQIEATHRYDRMSFGGGLAFDGGRIYVHSGLNFFVALDAASGAELWRSETLVPFHGAPTVADGRVFVSSDDNELLALDTDSGQVLWTYQGIVESARLLTAPSPAVLGDIVVAPFASGELIALRVQNGNPIWQDSLTRAGGLTAMSEINDVAGSPVVVDNTVYAMSHSGLLAAISLRTGERLWSQPAGGLHAPWVAGDFLYVTTSEAEIVCINRLDGEVYWITQLDLFENASERKNRLAWTGPVMAGGRIIVASSRGDMRVLNAYDGTIMSQSDLPGDVFIPPVIANETVYVVTDDARMIALR